VSGERGESVGRKPCGQGHSTDTGFAVASSGTSDNSLRVETDKQLFSIFRAGPHWLFELLDMPTPAGGCKFESITIKALETRLDGLMRPHSDTEPLRVVEFQWRYDAAIYPRIVTEMALVQPREAMRAIAGLVLFAHKGLDPQTKPWTKVVDAYYLPDALEKLTARDPQHPLLAAFAPLVEASDSKLEAKAAGFYRIITSSPVSSNERQALDEAFMSWLMHRFKTHTRKEIQQMLDLPSLKNTVSGRELWDEGLERGREQGLERGLEQGIIATLVRLAKRKFPGVQASTIQRIESLDYLSAEALTDEILDLGSVEALEQWLASR
jgi:predicted transposase YdaD